MTTALKFYDSLPEEQPREERRSALADFAEALMRRPGEWAEWPKSFDREHQAYCCKSNVNTGKLKNFPRGQFDAEKVGKRVYVRYIGAEG
ncbi:hypothetical protein 40AC_68 [Mycobacterium phage 40AC]|uniref:Uncharacterized protein n=1 Tax=Mycobacterium phage 40AC TaxID=1458717 RepID=W8EGE6_9CAUD|nr:hypothetical protein ST40AC_68 [Mycobacterium phage 40AC]AHJ86431.1 hypothetical protein 40AC_68 [Mycobacterium phage 40AC]